MSVLELKQQELEILDDLTPFAGRWVAIRDGHVIASDEDPQRLQQDPDVRSTDTFVAVGDDSTAFYLI